MIYHGANARNDHHRQGRRQGISREWHQLRPRIDEVFWTKLNVSTGEGLIYSRSG